MAKLEELFTGKLYSIQKKVKEKTGADLKIAFDDLQSNTQYSVNGTKPGWAASMIKIPVLIATFRAIDAGRLSLEDELSIDHRFTLDPTSEISYRQQGSTATVTELANYMILASCNESTNMLADRIGIPFINSTMQELNCSATRMSHLIYQMAPLEDPGIDGTSSNTTTAEEMTSLMKRIYRSELASPASCTRMRQILENDPALEYGRASVNHFLQASLPRGTLVGAKCGVLGDDIMETGVINGDYALTVMLNKLSSAAGGAGVISAISEAVYQRYYHDQLPSVNGDRERV